MLGCRPSGAGVSQEESFKVTDRRGRNDATAGPAPTESRSQGGSGPGLDALFMMFASSALASLGASPEAGEPTVDLDQARAAIDILIMLREKTAGNRTEHESRFLEEVLYDLQIRFVNASRATGAPGPA